MLKVRVLNIHIQHIYHGTCHTEHFVNETSGTQSSDSIILVHPPTTVTHHLHLLSSCRQQGCCNQNCGMCREQCRGGCSSCMNSDPCKMSCNHIPRRQLVLVCRDTRRRHTRPRQASIHFPLGAVYIGVVLCSFCSS